MVSDRSNGIYRGVIVALIGWLILVGNAQPISNSARSNTSTAQSNQEATQHSDIASGISRIGNQLEAQNAKTDPYEKERNDREIRDLQAQENSAYWAGAMFWATLGALVLSVIGVGLVWTTFRETQKANEISRKALKSHISIEGGALFGNDNRVCAIGMKLRNIGQTTAIQIQLSTTCRIFWNGDTIKTCQAITTLGQSPAHSFSMVAGEELQIRLETDFITPANKNGLWRIEVDTEMVYTDPFFGKIVEQHKFAGDADIGAARADMTEIYIPVSREA